MPSRGRLREAAAPSHAGLSTVMPRTLMTWQLDVPQERENRREAAVPFMTRPWSHTRRFCLVPFARTEAFGSAPRVSRGKAGRSAEGSGVIRAPHTPAPAPQLTVRIPGPIREAESVCSQCGPTSLVAAGTSPASPGILADLEPRACRLPSGPFQGSEHKS